MITLLLGVCHCFPLINPIKLLCMSTCNDLRTAEWIFIIFSIVEFYEKFQGNLSFDCKCLLESSQFKFSFRSDLLMVYLCKSVLAVYCFNINKQYLPFDLCNGNTLCFCFVFFEVGSEFCGHIRTTPVLTEVFVHMSHLFIRER